MLKMEDTLIRIGYFCVSPYGRLFNEQALLLICAKHLHCFCCWFEWPARSSIPNTMLESFSSLPSIFEYQYLGKDMKNTAELVIMKKNLYTVHTCQPSRIIRESPGYDTNLPVSHTGRFISRIKSSFELFCAIV